MFMAVCRFAKWKTDVQEDIYSMQNVYYVKSVWCVSVHDNLWTLFFCYVTESLACLTVNVTCNLFELFCSLANDVKLLSYIE